jgi:sarcosine oxidase subunit gamma
MAERALRQPPVFASPAGVRVLPPLARYALRVDVTAAAAACAGITPVAAAVCRASQLGDWHALWLGPDEQLLLGPVDAGATFAAAVGDALQGIPHSLVDVSHRQGAVEVSGPNAATLLNAGCPLDLGLAATPVGFCSRTVFGKSEVVLWRRAEDAFHLEVWRSFMPYVHGLLALVAAE